MIGPQAYARSLTSPSVRSKTIPGIVWQYQSRSDDHSKKACWLVMLDVLLHCPLLRHHVANGKVFFGINHQMRDFQQNRKKDLDLVLCTSSGTPSSDTFSEMASTYGIDLTAQEQQMMAGLPTLHRAPVGAVLVALEAKACMTEHGKARPRLYDELNSSHLTIHGATDQAIAAGLVVVNHADRFISPTHPKNAGGPPWHWNLHKQPKVTESVMEKVSELPRRSSPGKEGFDALSVLVLDCENDGSPVTLVTSSPSPQTGDALHYDNMIHRIANDYATRFMHI